MLYLLPFILATIACFSFILGTDGGEVCQENGIISFSFLNENRHALWLKGTGVGMLLCLSFLVFFIAGRYKFLSQVTALPALIYALLSVGIVCRYGVNNYLLAALCVVLAVARLQSAIVNTNSNAPVFGFGLFTVLAVLFFPKLVMLLAWAIVVLPFSGRANIKDMVALLLGFITVVLFAAAYYLWTDQLSGISHEFVNALLAGKEFRKLVSPMIQGAYAILGVLVIISLYHVTVNNPTAVVSQRRGIFSMLSMLLFTGSSFFFIPFACRGIMLTLAIPLSYLFSQYFISQRSRWIGNVLFALFLAACVMLS